MAESATLALPKDLIEPIIQAHIQNALSEALGDKAGLLSKMAWQILNTKVNSSGNPSTSSYDQAGTFLEVNLRVAFQKMLQQCLEEELEKHKETLKKYLTAELKKDKSPLTKALVEGMCNGVVTSGLKYRLTVEA